MRTGRAAAGLVGVLAAGAAVGAGELAAAFFRPAASPIVAVGNRLIDLTPESVRRWAIRDFGGNDKLVLLSGIYLAIAVLAIVVGILAGYRRLFGVLGLAVFGAVGCYCALTAKAHRGSDVVPAVVATVVGIAVLVRLTRLGDETHGEQPPTAAGSCCSAPRPRGWPSSPVSADGSCRPAGQTSRRPAPRCGCPRRGSVAPVLATGTDLGKSGVPFVTPASDFYRVDIALTVPQLDPAAWKLRVHGMVDHELTLTYDDVLARPLIERYLTLNCVSNEVGGNLISNGRFLGAPLADILREAGVSPEADQLVASGADGITIGTPTAVVMDGRDAMLAVGLDGAPLPTAHGFPVRMIVPGLFGYVSACKWIVSLEATTFDAVEAYWVQGGWAREGPVRLASRIDRPTASHAVRVGEMVTVAGVAWDQHVGVSKVQVQVDDGAWQDARLAPVPSIDTWRQWVYPWTVERPGKHTLQVRAFDAAGRGQDETRRDPFPSGATGLHRITVRAT